MSYALSHFKLSQMLGGNPLTEEFLDDEVISIDVEDVCEGGFCNLELIDLIVDRIKLLNWPRNSWFEDALEDFAFSGSIGTLEHLLYEIEEYNR